MDKTKENPLILDNISKETLSLLQECNKTLENI